MTGAFRFDARTHTYTVGDRHVPGITSVIRAAGYSDGEWCAPGALARGTAIHYATLRHDLGDDPPDLPEDWRGYFNAYLAFRASVRCEWDELEQPRIERAIGFAGTPDRVGRVQSRSALLELKTGGTAKWHPLQTAAQDILLGGARGIRQRLVVYLSKDGSFALREHRDPADYLNFLDALRTHGRS